MIIILQKIEKDSNFIKTIDKNRFIKILTAISLTLNYAAAFYQILEEVHELLVAEK